MKLRVRLLGYESGGRNVVLIDDSLAEALDVRPLDRVLVKLGDRHAVAIVNVARGFSPSEIGLYEEVARALGASDGDEVEVEPASAPESLVYIRKKLERGRLTKSEVYSIIRDIVDGYLSDVEIAALVLSLHFLGLSVEEMLYFTEAMVETGDRLNLKRRPILDKHSLGGVPGDKTSLLVVPIIASLGYTIPKTSSRAITSAAGTADRMEVLAPVNLSLDEMREVVEKVNGCIVWGGTLRLAPADDLIIKVEYPLGVDPFFIPSILAKKLAVGSTHVVLDIPTGRGTKARTIGEARRLARDFIELAQKLGMRLEVAITYGEEPVGYAIGPALEAREALEALMGRGPPDLVDKAVSLASILLEMVGVRGAKEAAQEALRSGKAEKKMREIIEAQGGDPNVKPEDIEVGDKTFTLRADRDGYVFWISNSALATIGKAAGAPRDKGAGILLHAKLGDRVRKGEPLMTVYAESSVKLQAAEKLVEELMPIAVGRGITGRMLLERIPAAPEKWVVIER